MCLKSLIICLNMLLIGVMPLMVSNRQAAGNCPYPSLRLGRVRVHQRGKFARFQCFKGYELYGQRYASCINGRWDVPRPACLKPGCPTLPKLDHGYLYYTHNNAAVMFFCESEYKLMGSSVATCNGTKWNTTFPQCVDFAKSPPTTCDFESANLCGWTLDETTNIQWHRTNRKTPSGIYGTGPSYDHTLGRGKDGFYMYIESSTRSDDAARLITPLYRANLSRDGCLNFYYHMFGRHTGVLRVIMKPENIDLNTIYNDDILKEKYLLFQKSGNLGDEWFHHKGSLTEIDQNFQIIFEGLRGSGYLSDVAIDDVSIFQGPKCVDNTETTDKNDNVETVSNEPIGKDSCTGRCSEMILYTVSPDDCYCYDGCLESNNCCVDYQDICVFPTTLESSTAARPNRLPTKHPMLPPSLKMIATEITKPEPSNASTVTIAKSTTVTTTERTTTPSSTTKPTTITTSTIRTTKADIPTTTKPKTTTQKVTKSTKKFTLPLLKFVSPETPAVNATGRINRPIIFHRHRPSSVPTTTETRPKTISVTPNTTHAVINTVPPQQKYTSSRYSNTTFKTTTTTKEYSEKYSRTFENYHEFVHRKNLKNDIAEVVEHKKLAALREEEKPISVTISPTTIVLEIVVPSLILVCVILEIYVRGRNSFFRKINWTNWYDYRNRRDNSSEVRFLTRDDGEEEIDL